MAKNKCYECKYCTEAGGESICKATTLGPREENFADNSSKNIIWPRIKDINAGACGDFEFVGGV